MVLARLFERDVIEGHDALGVVGRRRVRGQRFVARNALDLELEHTGSKVGAREPLVHADRLLYRQRLHAVGVGEDNGVLVVIVGRGGQGAVLVVDNVHAHGVSLGAVGDAGHRAGLGDGVLVLTGLGEAEVAKRDGRVGLGHRTGHGLDLGRTAQGLNGDVVGPVGGAGQAFRHDQVLLGSNLQGRRIRVVHVHERGGGGTGPTFGDGALEGGRGGRVAVLVSLGDGVLGKRGQAGDGDGLAVLQRDGATALDGALVVAGVGVLALERIAVLVLQRDGEGEGLVLVELEALGDLDGLGNLEAAGLRRVGHGVGLDLAVVVHVDGGRVGDGVHGHGGLVHGHVEAHGVVAGRQGAEVPGDGSVSQNAVVVRGDERGVRGHAVGDDHGGGVLGQGEADLVGQGVADLHALAVDALAAFLDVLHGHAGGDRVGGGVVLAVAHLAGVLQRGAGRGVVDGDLEGHGAGAARGNVLDGPRDGAVGEHAAVGGGALDVGGVGRDGVLDGDRRYAGGVVGVGDGVGQGVAGLDELAVDVGLGLAGLDRLLVVGVLVGEGVVAVVNGGLKRAVALVSNSHGHVAHVGVVGDVVAVDDDLVDGVVVGASSGVRDGLEGHVAICVVRGSLEHVALGVLQLEGELAVGELKALGDLGGHRHCGALGCVGVGEGDGLVGGAVSGSGQGTVAVVDHGHGDGLAGLGGGVVGDAGNLAGLGHGVGVGARLGVGEVTEGNGVVVLVDRAGHGIGLGCALTSSNVDGVGPLRRTVSALGHGHDLLHRELSGRRLHAVGVGEGDRVVLGGVSRCSHGAVAVVNNGDDDRLDRHQFVGDAGNLAGLGHGVGVGARLGVGEVTEGNGVVVLVDRAGHGIGLGCALTSSNVDGVGPLRRTVSALGHGHDLLHRELSGRRLHAVGVGEGDRVVLGGVSRCSHGAVAVVNNGDGDGLASRCVGIVGDASHGTGLGNGVGVLARSGELKRTEVRGVVVLVDRASHGLGLGCAFAGSNIDGVRPLSRTLQTLRNADDLLHGEAGLNRLNLIGVGEERILAALSNFSLQGAVAVVGDLNSHGVLSGAVLNASNGTGLGDLVGIGLASIGLGEGNLAKGGHGAVAVSVLDLDLAVGGTLRHRGAILGFESQGVLAGHVGSVQALGSVKLLAGEELNLTGCLIGVGDGRVLGRVGDLGGQRAVAVVGDNNSCGHVAGAGPASAKAITLRDLISVGLACIGLGVGDLTKGSLVCCGQLDALATLGGHRSAILASERHGQGLVLGPCSTLELLLDLKGSLASCLVGVGELGIGRVVGNVGLQGAVSVIGNLDGSLDGSGRARPAVTKAVLGDGVGVFLVLVRQTILDGAEGHAAS